MIKFFQTASIFALSSILFSCNNNMPDYRNIAMAEKQPLAEGRTDSLGMEIDIDFPECKNDILMKSMNTAIITTAFGEPYAEMEPDSAIEVWKKNIVEIYRKENLEFLKIIGHDEIPAGLNWEAFRCGKETTRTNKYISYSVETYDYSGGAHGIGYEYNMNFDSNTGKLLYMEDVFTEESYNEIGALLLKHLNDERDTEEEISLFSDKIKPNSNFTLKENGIVFTYNRYEIAAYAYGIIDIFIPAEEIKPYLKINLFN